MTLALFINVLIIIIIIKSRCVSILTEHMMMSFMGHLQLVTGVEKTLCR